MEDTPLPGHLAEPEQELGLLRTPSDTPADASRTLAGKEPQATTHQERASQLRPEDLVPKQHVERYDTFDSLRSSFGHRTNTGWSVAMSTTTDYTEPDLATLHDDDEEDEEAGTPALRGSAFPCPSDGFLPSLPPTRAPTFAPDSHDAVRRDDGAHPPREPASPRNPIVLPIRGLPPGPARSRDPTEPGQEAGTSHGASPPPCHPRATEPAVSDAVPQEGTLSTNSQMHHTVEPNTEHSEPSQFEGQDLQGSDRTLSQAGEESDADSSTTPNPGSDSVENVCDRVLRHAFRVGLQDLATTDAAATAWEATRYYLEELSRIVPTNGAAWVPSQSQMARDAGGYGQASSPSQGDGAGRGTSRNGGGTKRPSNDNAEDPNQDGFDDGSGSGGNGKRPRMDAQSPQVEDQNLSCPFRKRNPIKFNIRDFQSCAVQSFPDISQLKRHVKLFHKQQTVSGFACPRCKQNMGSKDALDRHLAVNRALICEVQTTPSGQNPEDGINARTEDMLNGRRANTKVDTWEILWKTLFPCDETADIQHPEFIPPIELEEVQSDFQLPSSHDDLRRRVAEAAIPEAHAAQIASILTQHIDFVFSTCRTLKTGNLPSQKRRRRTQKPKASPSDQQQQQSQQQHLSLRPDRLSSHFSYDGDSSPGDTGSAISGGSWNAAFPAQHLSPMADFRGLLTTESSNASIILSPGGGENGNPSPGMVAAAVFPSQDGHSPLGGASPVAGFDGPPLFPGPTTGGGAVFGRGGGQQFQAQRAFNQMMAFEHQGMGPAGSDRIPFQIATSMTMQPLGPGDELATAIDRSGGFAFTHGHLGGGHGHGHGGHGGYGG